MDLNVNFISYGRPQTISSVLIQHPDDIPEPQATDSGQEVYFEVLELQPIQLTLSFTRTERIGSEDKWVFLFVVSVSPTISIFLGLVYEIQSQ